MPTVNLGRIGFVNKSTYIGNTTAYKVNDIVKYNSSVYVCIQAHNVSKLPTDPLYWQVWVDTTNYYIKSEVDSLVLTELGTPIASATTTSVGGVTAGDVMHITGVTTITTLGLSVTGTIRTLIFDGVLVVTHNATTLILPGNANILTVAGSSATFVCESGSLGYWRCTGLTHQNVSMEELEYISNITSDAQIQFNGKQPTLVSGTNIRTINGQTLLGTSDLTTAVVATSVQKDNNTGAAYIPSGTTAQRPAAPAVGYMRFNTTLIAVEIWNGTAWSSVGGSTTSYAFTATAGQTAFLTTGTTLSTTPLVFLNGSLQQITVTYTVSGLTVTFLDARVLNDSVVIVG